VVSHQNIINNYS